MAHYTLRQSKSRQLKMQNIIHFSTLLVSGSDAASFLQGQLTCDIARITDQPSFGAYCDHRGRMIANFMIKKNVDHFYLILPSSMLDIVEEQLKKFAIFSKVTISQDETQDLTTIEHNKLILIKQGIAFLYPETSLLFTPQMISWEKHGGVSFTKGCYVGQEVVARTQHLGKLKRHMHHLTIIPNNTTTPTPGDDLTNDRHEPIGIICDTTVDNNTLQLLAVIQDDALKEKIFFCSHNAIIIT